MPNPSPFHPGDSGFDLRSPAGRPTRLAGSLWATALIVVAIVMLLLFVRLTHHQPRHVPLRSTIHESWIPPLEVHERVFAHLETPEDRP